MPADDPRPAPPAQDDFATTHWTLVLAAGNANESTARTALAALCETYWYPLYAYIRRRVGDTTEAQDLTQAFFAQLLERGTVAAANPERGRFRAYLLTACKRFIINEWHKERAQKRGGHRRAFSFDWDSSESRYSALAVDPLTPEQLFEQQWAITLLERVLSRLRAEYDSKGKAEQFKALKPFLTGAGKGETYAAAAQRMGISETAAKVAAHRLRKRYRELLRGEIAETVARPDEVDDEIRALFTVLAP